MRRRWLSLVLLTAVTCLALHAAPRADLPPLTNSRPLSPAEERATFAVPPGFRVELVAAEPQVIDPVAMTFDERGRIFVGEMHGYPNEGRGTGEVHSGIIKLLEDRDGDGVYESSRVWADNLRFPTGLMPWKGGLLVANAPELLYLEDSRGTGKADRRTVLYSGFDVANIQQMLNSLQFAHDNRVYAVAGLSGGTVQCLDKPGVPPVTLRGRGVRFRPDVPGSLEPTSGGGQYGLSADDWGRWFTATNSQHLRHIILPDHYLRRNASLLAAPSPSTSPSTAPPARSTAKVPSRRGASSAPPAAPAAPMPNASRRANWCPAASSPPGAVHWSTPPTCCRRPIAARCSSATRPTTSSSATR